MADKKSIHQFSAGEYFGNNNRYRLDSLIGVGGFADVWKAYDTQTHITVALKIYSNLDEEGIKNLAEEYARMYYLNHRNILKADNFDNYGNKPYLVMQYCAGGSLDKKIGKMSKGEIISVINDTCEGLQHLHRNQVIHLDIKPANILLRFNQENVPVYMLSDFGISQNSRRQLTRSINANVANIAFTPDYAPPEKFSPKKADREPSAAGDMYSLGISLYELITGELPYDDVSTGNQMWHFPNTEIDLDEINDPRLRWIVDLCVRRNPAERPTPEQVLGMLQAPENHIPPKYIGMPLPPPPPPPVNMADDLMRSIEADIARINSADDANRFDLNAYPHVGDTPERTNRAFYARLDSLGVAWDDETGAFYNIAEREEEARRRAEEEARRQAEEEARRRAEEEARRQAQEEARRRAQEEARRKAEAEAERQRIMQGLRDELELASDADAINRILATASGSDLGANDKKSLRQAVTARAKALRLSFNKAEDKYSAPVEKPQKPKESAATVIVTPPDSPSYGQTTIYGPPVSGGESDMEQKPWWKKPVAWAGAAVVLAGVGVCIWLGASAGEDTPSPAPYSPKYTTYTANGVDFKMTTIPAGDFILGADSVDGTGPGIQTHIKEFELGQTEVTQKLWQAVMGSNPSTVKGDDLPVNNVSWNDCVEFIARLNKLTGKSFSLPKEEEWEYAAKVVLSDNPEHPLYTQYPVFDLATYPNITPTAGAWLSANSKGTLHPVASLKPNYFGLYDMGGNVVEWCNSKYVDYHSGKPVKEPEQRVLRGAFYDSNETMANVAVRGSAMPQTSSPAFGLRLRLGSTL